MSLLIWQTRRDLGLRYGLEGVKVFAGNQFGVVSKRIVGMTDTTGYCLINARLRRKYAEVV